MTNVKQLINCLLLVMAALFTHSAMSEGLLLHKKEKLLRYQEVFHHFYRKDELNALINLQAGFANSAISPKVPSNQLLLGALYNNYGISSLGTQLLTNVTLSVVRKDISDLAWFYLAKEYFKEENYGKFEDAIKHIGNNLQPSEQNERLYLLGMYYIKTQDFKNAEVVLDNMDNKTNEYFFLMFNLGAAYLKANKIEQGVEYVTQVGSISHSDDTFLALRDKANIVLGYQYLRSNQSERAIKYFEQVRLEGAFSEKALLGLGWSYSQVSDHRRALVPWILLSEQDPTHIEVQEVLMAVPYTYSALESHKKSVELYRNSIAIYEDVKKKLDDAIGFVENASLFSMLFVNEEYDDFAISKQLKANLTSDLGKLLLEFLKEKDIQLMLDEYRDLLQLKAEAAKWRQKLQTMNLALGNIDDTSEIVGLPNDGQVQAALTLLPGKIAKKIQYKEYLLTLGDRVKLQEERLNILLEMHEQKIRENVLVKLKKRDQYVVTYLSQTRYSLAELLDKSRGDN